MTPLPPEIARVLKPHQVTPATTLAHALTQGRGLWGYPGGIDMSEVGTGKTYVDLAAMLATGLEPVVLCPVVGLDGWIAAFAAFGAHPRFIGSWESVRGGFRPEIAWRDGDRYHWNDPITRRIGLILDEAQAVRNADSLTSRCIDGAIHQGIPIICASATLAFNPTELRVAGRVTGLHEGGPDWDRFLVEHGCRWDEEKERWVNSRSPRHMAEIHRQLFPYRAVRMRKDQVQDRPKNTITVLPIQTPEGPAIEAEWHAALEELAKYYKQKMPEARIEGLRRSVRSRLWQRCEMALVDPVAERIHDDVQSGASVVVFVSFTRTRMAFASALRTHAGLYGGQNKHQRSHWTREFQANREHILINNIGAGGASVSLHDTTGERPRITYIFPTDNPVRFGQAPGRADRLGGMSEVRQFIPCVAGSISERMVWSTAKKMARLAALHLESLEPQNIELSHD